MHCRRFKLNACSRGIYFDLFHTKRLQASYKLNNVYIIKETTLTLMDIA